VVLIGPVDNPEKYLETLHNEFINHKDIKYTVFEKETYLLKDKALYLLSNKEFRKLQKNTKILFRKGKTGLIDLGLEGEEEKKASLEKAKKYFKDFKEKSDDQRFYISKDGKNALFMIKPVFESIDLKKSKKLIQFVQETVDKVLGSTPHHIIGRYIEKVRDTQQMKNDISKTGIISLVAIFFILLYGMRSISSSLFVMVGVVLSLGQAIGGAYYFVGQINILTGFLLAILACLGADYGIHLVQRYFQERAGGKSHEEAIEITYLDTGRALFSACFSTAIAFFCLKISDFRGFSELGIIAGFGIICIYLTFILIFPTMAGILQSKEDFSKRFKAFSYYPFKTSHMKFIFILIPFLIYGAYKSEFEYDFNRMRDISLKSRELKDLSKELYGKSTSPSAVLAPDKETAAALVEWASEDEHSDVIQKVISRNTILPNKMQARFRKIKRLKKMVLKASDSEIKEKTGLDPAKIKRWLNQGPYTEEDLPPSLRHAFGSSGNIVLLYPAKHNTNRENIYNFSKVLNKAKEKFAGIQIGSNALVFLEIIDFIVTDGKLVLLLFLVGCFITFMIDFKDLKMALSLEAQLIFGTFFLLGLMGLFDIRFTILNVAMFPAILAAGIDMGVHVKHRELHLKSALKGAKSTSQAIHLSLATTLAGFGSLFFAEAKMLNGIAWISVLGIVGMYLVCMVFIPIITDYFRKT